METANRFRLTGWLSKLHAEFLTERGKHSRRDLIYSNPCSVVFEPAPFLSYDRSPAAEFHPESGAFRQIAKTFLPEYVNMLAADSFATSELFRKLSLAKFSDESWSSRNAKKQ